MSVPVETLQSLCVGGYPARGRKPSEESDDGIPIIKLRNVTGRGISLDTEYAPLTDEVREECAQALLQQNDLLITSTGEGTIGRADLYQYPDAAIADGHVTICRLHEGVNLRYGLEFLRSEYGQIQMLRHVSGSTGQTELLIDHIKSLRIPIPAPEVQDELVRLLDDARGRSEELLLRAQALRQEGNEALAVARHEMIERLTG